MYTLSRRALLAAGLGAMTATMPAHADDVDDDNQEDAINYKESNLLSLNDYVFNTEAHPIPINKKYKS